MPYLYLKTPNGVCIRETSGPTTILPQAVLFFCSPDLPTFVRFFQSQQPLYFLLLYFCHSMETAFIYYARAFCHGNLQFLPDGVVFSSSSGISPEVQIQSDITASLGHESILISVFSSLLSRGSSRYHN